jgi:transposase InsO family protein
MAPRYLRSDNGPEFVSRAILRWLLSAGIETACIDPGKPWQNGLDESFNGKFRDDCLSIEWFRTRPEATAVIESWQHYNDDPMFMCSSWLRTPKTMIPAPTSATLAPMTSQRSGRTPSTAPEPTNGGHDVDASVRSVGTPRRGGVDSRQQVCEQSKRRHSRQQPQRRLSQTKPGPERKTAGNFTD